MTRFAFVLGLLLAAAPAFAAPVNLITNGDFSGGNANFSTTYDYRPGIETGWDPGVYSVETAGNPWHSLFVKTGDHTTGDGKMMVVNGMTEQSTVWELTLSGLQLNTNYFFEAFLLNLCCEFINLPGPELQFWANGSLLGAGSTDKPGGWAGLSTNWNSGSSTTAVLRLTNASTIFSGNDFALDDVFFGTESSVNPIPTPEPASMLLLGTGLALIGARARKRLGKSKA